jgi:small ligand-binding sensory domain FIST
MWIDDKTGSPPMTVATALVSGNDPLPQLAEEAVHRALARAGLTHANGVLIFLTPEFARHAQPTVTAAARAAQCTQVAGGIAAGVFTESGWAVDRPAAAAMVFGGGLSLGHPEPGDHALLSYAGATFPPDWSDSATRFGGSFSGSVGYAEAVVWQQSRLSGQRCSVQILGAQVGIGVSSGLQLLGEAQAVERSNGYDLERLGGQAALKSLTRVLPPELRHYPPQHLHHLHHLSAVLSDGDDAEAALSDGRYRPIAIIAANADNSLTLAEHVAAGQYLAWAIRQPLATEADMRQMIDRLGDKTPNPACALMFSCIGRGPYFYAGEDRDLQVLCARFPGLPVLGTYGTGQIAAAANGARRTNRELHNAVVAALVSTPGKEADVQSIA